MPSDILNIELSFEGMERGKTCTISKIKIDKGQIPASTKKVSLVLEDVDLLNLPHGIHFFEFENADIVLEDEFKIMPLTPPPGKSHHYRLTARAFDSKHRIVGVGTVIKQFP